MSMASLFPRLGLRLSNQSSRVWLVPPNHLQMPKIAAFREWLRERERRQAAPACQIQAATLSFARLSAAITAINEALSVS